MIENSNSAKIWLNLLKNVLNGRVKSEQSAVWGGERAFFCEKESCKENVF